MKKISQATCLTHNLYELGYEYNCVYEAEMVGDEWYVVNSDGWSTPFNKDDFEEFFTI